MNYLIIGNGFDLAHDYKTTYTQFLDWVKDEISLYNTRTKEKRYDVVLNFSISSSYISNYPNVVPNRSKFIQKEIWECINENFWLKYFITSLAHVREGWTGFEGEIRIIIEHIDSVMRSEEGQFLNKTIQYDTLLKLPDNVRVLPLGKDPRTSSGLTTYKELIEIMKKDLSRLIRLFEIYLIYYSYRRGNKNKFPRLRDIKIDRVISFNYTDTFSKIYSKEAEVCYVHGKIDKEHEANTDNLVLGIEEYLDKDKADNEVELISFKKYYQRLVKRADSDYLIWSDEIANGQSDIYDPTETALITNGMIEFDSTGDDDFHNVYIIGHSLDVNDADILRGFILNNNVRTQIFYRDDKDYANKIANLVRVIGKDELIKRTVGRYRSIFFENQKVLEK